MSKVIVNQAPENVIPDHQKDDVADLLGLNDKKEDVKETETKVEDDKETTTDDKDSASTLDQEEEVDTEIKKKEEETDTEEEEVQTVGEDKLLTELSRLSALLTPEQTGEFKFETEEGKKEDTKDETIDDKEKKIEDQLTPISDDVPSFVGNSDFDKIFEDNDRKTLQNVLQKVVKTTREQTRRAVMKDIMDIVPQFVTYNIQGAMAAQEFWNENPELKNLTKQYPKVKQYVQFRATEIQKSNPKLTLGEVYAKTRQEVVELLGDRLKDKGNGSGETTSDTGKRPGLARRPGAKRGDTKGKIVTDDQQKHILDLINFNK